MPAPATAPGILTQIPDAFLRAVVDFELPPVGRYAVGMAFLPDDADGARRAEGRHRGRSPPSEGLRRARLARGARPTPTTSAARARERMPVFEQLFVARPSATAVVAASSSTG